ncbi:hypothetical protein RJ640_012375 [Escallonia rubra]|uniref:Cation/H+ exchanger domain-containing protein n=1 Tax=Escallonia rubra TaxID=112253 RepID=A0AA88RNU1_9ASTE|nr:hypothetical protein RJ640_012375 [Escallonia rubra]
MVNQNLFNGTVVPIMVKSLRPGVLLSCFAAQVEVDNGTWYQVNPLDQALPIFVVQLILITTVSKLAIVVNKYFKSVRQPLIVAEILAGVALGNSGLGMWKTKNSYVGALFNIDRVLLLETFGNLGLIYYWFLLGLEMDVTTDTLHRIGKKAYAIALSGAVMSFVTGLGLYRFCLPYSQSFSKGFLFWGVALSVTGLPALTEVLASLKLLHSDVGRTAMSVALVNGIFSWVSLTVVIVVSTHSILIALCRLAAMTIFILFCVFAIRPAIIWVLQRTDGDEYSEGAICIILAGVLACGLATDLIGVTSLVGAFVFGLIIPHDVLGNRFVVAVQGFVADFLMPVWFTLCGFRTHALSLKVLSWWKVCTTVTVACIIKPATTLVVSYFCDLPLHEGISLALMLNTKGLTALVALTAGDQEMVINEAGYVVMYLSILLMTMVPSPLLHFLYKPKRRFLPSKHRALQKLKPDAELKILACTHEMQTVAGMVNLLEASNATKRSPIRVFALQLIPLTRQTTALLIVHSSSGTSSHNSRSRADAQTEQIIKSFAKLEGESTLFSVQPLTAMSSYATMHEDICSIAEDKDVALIVLPFHRRQTIHNRLEDANPAYKDVNDNVLANAPCSVGIIVDRGLGSFNLEMDSDDNAKDVTHHIAMIYIGGCDDREALAYAWRMGGHPKATLTVMRFIPGENPVEVESLMEETNGVISVTMDAEKERQLDDCFINEFRHKNTGNKSVVFLEHKANHGAETIATLKSMGENFNMYIVGRSLGVVSPLTAGLADWSDCPELGSIGDLLVTSEFSSTASVLVVQQYAGIKPSIDGSATPDSSEENIDNYGHLTQRVIQSSFELAVNQKERDDGMLMTQNSYSASKPL